MHSQKNSEIRRDLTESRCALATATCLQHPERHRTTFQEIGPDLFRVACNMGLEGLVSKRAYRPHLPNTGWPRARSNGGCALARSAVPGSPISLFVAAATANYVLDLRPSLACF